MPLDRPLPDDIREALKMLWSINEDQQVHIDQHRDSLHKVWHVAPVKPRDGMLVYADGTNWNPGSGAGYYVYYAGAWHAMSGGGGGGAVTSVFTRTGAVVAVTGDYTAAQVTNAVSVLGSYANPTWIPSYAYSKLTGVPTSFTPAAHVHAAADITTGVMAVARLGTGTPSSLNYLRGDGTWATVTTGQNQTPWLSNINAASFNLTSVGSLGIGTASPSSRFQCLGVTPTVPAPGTYGGAIFSNDNSLYGLYVGSVSTGNSYVQAQRGDSATTYNLLLQPNGGSVGIGTASPGYQLHVSTDSAAKPTTSAWTISSDARVKRDVKDLQGGLEVIGQLRPVEATYNGLGGTPEGERVVSFIAQEILPVLPGTVKSGRGKLSPDDPEEIDILGVNIHEVLMHLVVAVKQLKEKVEALEAAAVTP